MEDSSVIDPERVVSYEFPEVQVFFLANLNFVYFLIIKYI